MPGKTPEPAGGPQNYNEDGYEYWLQKYSDGRVEHWRRKVDIGKDPGPWEQQADTVDADLADLYKTRQASEPKPKEEGGPPETREFADGTTRQWDPKTGKWEEVAKAPAKPPTAAAAPQTITTAASEPFIDQMMPDGTTRRVPNPRFDPTAKSQADAAQARAITAEEIKQKGAELDLQVKAGKITTDQRDREFDEWIKVRQDEDRVARLELARQQEARMAQQEARAGKKDEREAVTSDRSSTVAERNAAVSEGQLARQTVADERSGTQADQTLRYNQQQAAYNVGGSAVDDYLKLAPMRVGPQFGQNFSSALNSVSSGSGAPLNFGAGDFMSPTEDINALRDREMAKAMAMFQGAAPVAPTGVGPGAEILPPVPSPVPPVAPYLYPGYKSMPR